MYQEERLATTLVGGLLTFSVEPVTVPLGVLSLMIILKMLTEVDERGMSFDQELGALCSPSIKITGGVIAAMLAAMTAT